MLAQFISAGFDPADFWSLTPRQIDVYRRGAALRFKRENHERIMLAWYVAALDRQPRKKPLPKLQRLLGDDRPKARRQTVEQQIAIAKAWTKAINK